MIQGGVILFAFFTIEFSGESFWLESFGMERKAEK
jgi:hypothetical protein